MPDVSCKNKDSVSISEVLIGGADYMKVCEYLGCAVYVDLNSCSG